MLGEYLMRYAHEAGGYNFNEFHYLAISSNSIEDFKNMKYTNINKKSNEAQDQITPYHIAACNSNLEILKEFQRLKGDLYA